MNLNPQQQAIVESREESICVVAGPGSGKTRTLVERIKRLAGIGENPRGMVVLTYTNAGAHELRERLGSIRLGYLGTLHGFCFRLLQNFGSGIGYRQGGINLLTEDMATDMLDATAKKLHWKGSKVALAEQRNDAAKLIWKDYQHTLKRNNLVDYDTVLVSALTLLSHDNPATFPKPPDLGITHLFVDELQDSAEVDFDIIEEIAAQWTFLVGDLDQSIYGFRGARPEVFRRWATRADVALYYLEKNYRSGFEICCIAQRLIGHNISRIPKEMEPAAHICTVTARCFRTDADEMLAIAARVKMANSVAVLCRTNAFVTQVATVLKLQGIPVRESQKMDLPPDWSHALNVLSLWNDPRNNIVTERVMRRPGADAEKIEHAKRLALDTGCWLSAAAATAGLTPARLHPKPWPDIGEALPQWGIGKESVELILKRLTLLPQESPTVADLLQDLFMHDRWEKQEETGGVTVTTIHRSKGREWDVVFLPAWEETIIPQTKKDTDLEEERRLAFVAITRAAHECHISCAAVRMLEYKGATSMTPSRFIAEAGLTLSEA